MAMFSLVSLRLGCAVRVCERCFRFSATTGHLTLLACGFGGFVSGVVAGRMSFVLRPGFWGLRDRHTILTVFL